ncbi:MAG: NADPH-dependent F420 reductase [bacterium]|nr:NADPH-dependent F420 reductase [bacterium]
MISILGPVAILGGTGDLGRGLAARLGTAGREVVIGSRDAGRAHEAAARLGLPSVRGAANADAVGAAEIVVLAIPLEGHAAFVEGFAGPLSGKIVVDATVPLGPGFTFVPPPAGSAAAETQDLAPCARVVAAFHTLSARLLADLTRPLDQDVLVCGDDPDARAEVLALATAIGARGVDAGGLAAAATIEGMAVLLIGLNVRYKRRHLGFRIAHLPPDARPR